MEEPMANRSLVAWLLKGFPAVAFAGALLALAGCVNNPGGNANAGATENSNSAATSGGPDSAREPIYAKEPDQYSETITITVEPAGQDEKVKVPPLQFDFARRGGDRRAAFQLPSLGQVIYLEHSGLKYIVLPARNQYMELDQATLGVELPKLSLMTPTSVVEHLKSSAQYYKLGAEDVNGRPAIKYRFTGKINSQTAAGDVDTDSTVYLDETTGLPVRAEILGSTAGGKGARVMLQMSNVQLNPDRASFDVPIGYKKVTSGELRQQVNSLASTMRIVALSLTQQIAPAPGPSTGPSPGPSQGQAPGPSKSPARGPASTHSPSKASPSSHR
jgi:hypothetical protein